MASSNLVVLAAVALTVARTTAAERPGQPAAGVNSTEHETVWQFYQNNRKIAPVYLYTVRTSRFNVHRLHLKHSAQVQNAPRLAIVYFFIHHYEDILQPVIDRICKQSKRKQFCGDLRTEGDHALCVCRHVESCYSKLNPRAHPRAPSSPLSRMLTRRTSTALLGLLAMPAALTRRIQRCTVHRCTPGSQPSFQLGPRTRRCSGTGEKYRCSCQC